MNAYKTYMLDASQEHGHTLLRTSFKLFLLIHNTCMGYAQKSSFFVKTLYLALLEISFIRYTQDIHISNLIQIPFIRYAHNMHRELPSFLEKTLLCLLGLIKTLYLASGGL